MRFPAKPDRSKMTNEEVLDYFSQRLETYLTLIRNGAKLPYPNANRCRKWGIYAAHAALELNPGLRDKNAEPFHAEGRRKGLHGRSLAKFITESLQQNVI